MPAQRPPLCGRWGFNYQSTLGSRSTKAPRIVQIISSLLRNRMSTTSIRHLERGMAVNVNGSKHPPAYDYDREHSRTWQEFQTTSSARFASATLPKFSRISSWSIDRLRLASVAHNECQRREFCFAYTTNTNNSVGWHFHSRWLRNS
jgi:hypothetical protein